MSKPFEDFANKTVNNPLYREMKLAIFEDCRTWVPNPANPEVGFGLFQGVMRTFEKIEEYGALQPKEPKKKKEDDQPEESSDPDLN